MHKRTLGSYAHNFLTNYAIESWLVRVGSSFNCLQNLRRSSSTHLEVVCPRTCVQALVLFPTVKKSSNVGKHPKNSLEENLSHQITSHEQQKQPCANHVPTTVIGDFLFAPKKTSFFLAFACQTASYHPEGAKFPTEPVSNFFPIYTFPPEAK